ncbi:hypothetical protein PHLGIDRAFT_79987, partial [Phlebiopsis gigantea 11061_1 CR5-6]
PASAEGTYGHIQLDVVVPESFDLQDQLSQLSTQYYERRWKLSDFAAFAETHVQRFSDLLALGKPGALDPDVWCVDTRGVLTLSVCKSTYERLGLVGTPLPWKEHQDTGPWDVVFHVPEAPTDGAWQVRRVTAEARALRDVHMPKVSLCVRPSRDSSAMEEWDESAAELFEWVGLACLGSERIRVNDKPDPYICVYAPPAPSHTENLVHIRWKGLLPPPFVQSVIDIASQAPLAGIVANSTPASPVVYLPPPPSMRYPRRATRDESEDCWSLVVARSDRSDEVQWLLAESIGRWDSRWG